MKTTDVKSRLIKTLAVQLKQTGGVMPPESLLEAVAHAGKSLVEVPELRWRFGSVYRVVDAQGQGTEYRAIVRARAIHYEPDGPGTGNWRAFDVTVLTDYYGETGDGRIYGEGATYAGARSTSTDCSSSLSVNTVGQKFEFSLYGIYRSYLSFNTSGIPANADVTAAALYVCAQIDTSDTDFNVQVYHYAWAEALCDNREANYDGAYGGSATLEGTLRNTADGWVGGTYYNLAVAVARINKFGDTKYTLVSGRDVGNVAPSGNEYVTWRATEYSGTGSDPYLAITFTMPTQPLKITVNGTDRTAGIPVESISIDNVLTSQADSAHFVILNGGAMSLNELQSVIISSPDDATRYFAGYIRKLESHSRGPMLDYDVECVDYTWYLEHPEALVTGTYAGQNDSAIIANFMASACPDVDVATYVETVLAVVNIEFDRETPRAALDRLAALAGADWYVDYGPGPGGKIAYLHYFDAGTNPAPFSLSDAPDYVTDFVYEELIEIVEAPQANKVIVVGQGTVTATRTKGAEGDYGWWLTTKLVDTNITTVAQAQTYGDQLLNELASNPVYTCRIRKPGLKAGHTVTLVDSRRGVNGSFMLNRVHTTFDGGGYARYSLELGAYIARLPELVAQVIRTTAAPVDHDHGGGADGTDAIHVTGNIVITAAGADKVIDYATANNMIAQINGGSTLIAAGLIQLTSASTVLTSGANLVVNTATPNTMIARVNQGSTLIAGGLIQLTGDSTVTVNQATGNKILASINAGSTLILPGLIQITSDTTVYTSGANAVINAATPNTMIAQVNQGSTLIAGGLIHLTGSSTIDADSGTGNKITAAVNAGSTTILPGLILISGAVTLANWRDTGNQTLIAGGYIATNTIECAALKAGTITAQVSMSSAGTIDFVDGPSLYGSGTVLVCNGTLWVAPVGSYILAREYQLHDFTVLIDSSGNIRGNSYKVGTTTVITAARVLQNVSIDAGVTGGGGLDVDKTDGYHATITETVSAIVVRDAEGDINVHDVNKSGSCSAVVKTTRGQVRMVSIESPEVWFVDVVDPRADVDALFREVCEGEFWYMPMFPSREMRVDRHMRWAVWGKRKDMTGVRFEPVWPKGGLG